MTVKALIPILCLVIVSAAAVSISPADPVPFNARWMQNLFPCIANYTLRDIMIPGTHDSGAYVLYNAFAPGTDQLLDDLVKISNAMGLPTFELVRVWALAQNRTFYEQLYGGIRYLDVRACFDSATNEWRTFHMILGVPTQILLNDVHQFLLDFPNEVVILEMSHFDGSDATTKELLAEMLETTFSDMMWPSTKGFGTIGEMVEVNQRAFITFDDSAVTARHPNLWNSGILSGSYANTPIASKMIAWNHNKIETEGGDGSLFELSWTLTTDADSVVEGIVAPELFPDTLQKLARVGNWYLEPFAQNYSTFSLGNMVLVDHMQESYVVEIAKIRNRRMCYDDASYRAIRSDGQDCRGWAAANNCSNSFVAQHCPLSCNKCAPVPGEPGDACDSGSECLSKHCAPPSANAAESRANTAAGRVCLVDDPRTEGEPCGNDLQCWSVRCDRKHNVCLS